MPQGRLLLRGGDAEVCQNKKGRSVHVQGVTHGEVPFIELGNKELGDIRTVSTGHENLGM